MDVPEVVRRGGMPRKEGTRGQESTPTLVGPEVSSGPFLPVVVVVVCRRRPLPSPPSVGTSSYPLSPVLTSS